MFHTPRQGYGGQTVTEKIQNAAKMAVLINPVVFYLFWFQLHEKELELMAKRAQEKLEQEMLLQQVINFFFNFFQICVQCDVEHRLTIVFLDI